MADSKRKEYQARYYQANAEKRKKQSKQWIKDNPIKTKHHVRKQLLKKYGLTFDSYQDLLDKQQGACAICQKHSEKTLAVDHCHTTNEVRGLLCTKCNTALGKFNDSIEMLQRAEQYLRKRL